MTTKQRFEVRNGGDWIRVSKAIVTGKGWLHFEIRDKAGTTTGLAQPKNWRIIEAHK